MNNKYLIEMKNINKTFGHVEAIKNVDFKVGKAEVVGLVGDNAAGKSTLMKILSGVLLPDSGTIFKNGEEISIKNRMDAKELGIEMVFQELAVFDKMDVKGNIFINREAELGGFFNSRLMKFWLNEKRMEKRAIELLKNLKIDLPSVRSLVKNLSGGQRQAVAIARVLLSDANIIIMDEPTAALAVKEVEKTLNIITSIKKTGTSVVLISHRMDDIFRVADRVIVLRRGSKVGERLIKECTPQDVVSLIVGATCDFDVECQ